jgi:hypothetical protein
MIFHVFKFKDLRGIDYNIFAYHNLQARLSTKDCTTRGGSTLGEVTPH